MSSIHAQKNPVFYGGLELFRHTAFENNSFGNFSFGSQLVHWKIFAPEVGFSHYGGAPRERDIFGMPGTSSDQALFQSRFHANVLTLTPKLKFGKDDAFISFSSNYHVGRAVGKANFYTLDGRKYVLQESQKRISPVSFWSFSLGIEGFAIQEEKYWFTILLTYTEVDANAALSQLDFEESGINSPGINTTTIGVGIRFYYNPFPLPKD